jgi:hypothetical protein
MDLNPDWQPPRFQRYVILALATVNALAAFICGVLNQLSFWGDAGVTGLAATLLLFGTIGVVLSTPFTLSAAVRYPGIRAQVLSAAAVFAGQQLDSSVLDPLSVTFVLQFALLALAAWVWQRRIEAAIYLALLLLSPIFIWLTLS